jgi:hypothetical protein
MNQIIETIRRMMTNYRDASNQLYTDSTKLSEYNAAKTLNGARLNKQRGNKHVRFQAEMVESLSLVEYLVLLEDAIFRRFLALSQFQWSLHHDSEQGGVPHRRPTLVTGDERNSLEEALNRKFFKRIEDEYNVRRNLCLVYSNMIRGKMENATKDLKRMVRDDYVVCGGCNCMFHKLMLNLYAPQTPLFASVKEDLMEEEGWSFTCIDCDTVMAFPVSKTFISYQVVCHAPPLPVQINQNGGKKKGRSKKRKKKKPKQVQSLGDEVNVSEETNNATSTVPQMEEFRLNNTNSPIAVAMRNDDWVDFLQKSGSIIALNQYMDSVLGEDDSVVLDECDSLYLE